MDLQTELKRIFGFETFRGDQEAIVKRTLAGGHSLVLMPTGMGKSVCYQLPACLTEGLTLVVSPLIALMKDQVDKVKRQGVEAAAVNSSLNREERERAYHRLKRGQLRILYVTPERFRKPDFLEALKAQPVRLLAVDEAHCISQWGHDFRPDYSRVGEFRKLLGDPVTMALTATATRSVQSDIIQQFGFSKDEVETFDHGIERPNLEIQVQSVYGLEEKVRWIVMLRHQVSGPMIVYVSLISTMQKLSRELQKLGLPHLDYHGQLPEKFRRRNQEQFLNSDAELMLATPAFGLGVDKPNIRSIVHAEIPGSIESYYQEIGRAGRDGLPSHCNLLYDQDDLTIQMDFNKWANPDPGFYRALYNLLNNNEARVRSEGLDYLRESLNFYNSRDFRLETALNMLERWGAIEMDNEFKNIRVVSEIPQESQDDDSYKRRLEMGNKRLSEMANFANLKDGHLEFIYRYFRG